MTTRKTRATDVPPDVMDVIRGDVRETLRMFEAAAAGRDSIPREAIDQFEAVGRVIDMAEMFLDLPEVVAVRDRVAEMTDDEALQFAFAYREWAKATMMDSDKERGVLRHKVELERVRQQYEAEFEQIRRRDDARGRAVRFMENEEQQHGTS